jgi:hypothetical protein
VIAFRAGFGNRRAKQSLTRSSGESLKNARDAFRIWRKSRPFWGGLLVIVAAGEMLVSERAPLQVVTHIGTQGVAGYLIPTFMLLCGALLWFKPIDRSIHSLLAIFLALGSWITSDLGGYFVGMMVGVVGGALAFAWTTDEETASPDWFRSKPWIGLRSWAVDLIVRLHAQWHRIRKAAADRQDPLTLMNSLLSSPGFLKTLARAARRRLSSGRCTRSSGIQLNSIRRLKVGIRPHFSRIWRRPHRGGTATGRAVGAGQFALRSDQANIERSGHAARTRRGLGWHGVKIRLNLRERRRGIRPLWSRRVRNRRAVRR